jgi:hypothetical protein
MQLKLTRSQRESGVLSKAVMFCLDARAQLTQMEQYSINRYRLGGQLIYNSEASQRRVKAGEAAMANGTGSGNFKALAQFAIARLHLNITVNSLQLGQHIECKSLEELQGAEDAIMTACQNLKAYLDTAATFDGREVLIDFSGTEPVVVSTAPPPMLVAPPAYAAAPPATPPAPIYPQSQSSDPAPAPTQGWTNTMPPPALAQFLRLPFDEYMRRVRELLQAASPEFKVLIGAGGLFVLVVLYNIL